MFAPAFGRVVRSSSATCAVPVRSLRLPGLLPAHQTFRPIHQRRLSSSKPTAPPNKQKKPAEKVEQAAADSPPEKAATSELKDKLETKATENLTANSSSTPVEVTSTLLPHERDILLASFFEDHRPLNVRDDPLPLYGLHPNEGWKTGLPVVHGSSDQYFDDPRIPTNDLSEPALTIIEKTLLGAYHNLQYHIDAQQKALADAKEGEAAQFTEESITQWAEQLNSSFPPRPPPPPPAAFAPLAGDAAQESKRVTEVAVPQRPATRRQHVHRKRGGMFLISVKRQRKLKMKKHKYKKLMKRTRLERRKLDRT